MIFMVINGSYGWQWWILVDNWMYILYIMVIHGKFYGNLSGIFHGTIDGFRQMLTRIEFTSFIDIAMETIWYICTLW